jgi:hypothetical protein
MFHQDKHSNKPHKSMIHLAASSNRKIEQQKREVLKNHNISTKTREASASFDCFLNIRFFIVAPVNLVLLELAENFPECSSLDG